ncbi:MAG: zinc ribbon domain-containing protein [bacterium]
MPVYEYCCNACNIQFELRQKFSDPPADRCPKCGGTVRKMVSAVSFSLKGAGWFGDGYGAKAEPTSSEGDTAAVAATEVVSTDAVPAETTASPATQASAPAQTETKSTAAETPTASRDKADVGVS